MPGATFAAAPRVGWGRRDAAAGVSDSAAGVVRRTMIEHVPRNRGIGDGGTGEIDSLAGELSDALRSDLASQQDELTNGFDPVSGNLTGGAPGQAVLTAHGLSCSRRSGASGSRPR